MIHIICVTLHASLCRDKPCATCSVLYVSPYLSGSLIIHRHATSERNAHCTLGASTHALMGYVVVYQLRHGGHVLLGVCPFLCLYVCLLATLRKKLTWLHLHENVTKDVYLDREVPLKFRSPRDLDLDLPWGGLRYSCLPVY